MANVTVADSIPQRRILTVEPSSLLIGLLFVVVAFLVLTPLFLLLVGSFQLARPGEAPVWGLAGWKRAFSDPSILEALWNTVSLAVVRQAIALVIGVILAWLIARTDLPWKRGLEFMFWISFFLPPCRWRSVGSCFSMVSLGCSTSGSRRFLCIRSDL